MSNRDQCQKCGSTKIIPNVQIFDQGQYSDTQLKVAINEHPDAWIFKGTHLGVLRAWICGECGHTAIYLDNPQELYAKYLEIKSKNEATK